MCPGADDTGECNPLLECCTVEFASQGTSRAAGQTAFKKIQSNIVWRNATDAFSVGLAFEAVVLMFLHVGMKGMKKMGIDTCCREFLKESIPQNAQLELRHCPCKNEDGTVIVSSIVEVANETEFFKIVKKSSDTLQMGTTSDGVTVIAVASGLPTTRIGQPWWNEWRMPWVSGNSSSESPSQQLVSFELMQSVKGAWRQRICDCVRCPRRQIPGTRVDIPSKFQMERECDHLGWRTLKQEKTWCDWQKHGRSFQNWGHSSKWAWEGHEEHVTVRGVVHSLWRVQWKGHSCTESNDLEDIPHWWLHNSFSPGLCTGSLHS